MIEGLKYCTRCLMPETAESIIYDEYGICRACNSSEIKMTINWKERQNELKKILDSAKKESGENYDCVIPISGGKDSIFQLHVIKNIYKLQPLAVTFNHNWLSKIGFYNLMNALEKIEVDHIMYTPNRNLINRLAKKSIFAIGDSCWHCHSGIGSFALQIAQKFKIKLLIWGESIAENSGKASFKDPKFKFDRDYFTKVSAKLSPSEISCGSFTKEKVDLKELSLFNPPSKDEIAQIGVYGIHLGDFIFWDDERHTEFVKEKFDWLEGDVERTYKGYKSVECVMEGVHSFMGYLKRGFGRATWQASMDVRNGIITREEGMEIIKKYEKQVPNALGYFLEITSLSEKEFYQIINSQKQEQLKDKDLPLDKNYSYNKKINRPFILNFLEETKNEFKE